MARVLVVDDVAANAEFARMVLTDIGYRVTIVADAASALLWLATTTPDLILLDMSMPGMTGRQFLEAYRSGTGHPPPVIAISAERRFAYLFKAGALDVADFLLKPFNLEALVACVEKYAGSASSPIR